MYGGADYWKFANETILTIAMIETQQALDNLDAILKTPGLDSIYVGPLRPRPLARLPARARSDDAEGGGGDQVHHRPRRKKHKIPAGIHCAAPAWAREMIGIGYQLVTLGNDNSLMMGAARAAYRRNARRRRQLRAEAGSLLLTPTYGEEAP
jgi:4-hydroxy-2-oxoheptanedioate aldolase